MGLFGSAEPLDPEYAQVLHTGSDRARKAVAKGQDGIRNAVPGGEQVLGIVIDELSHDETLVLTSHHLLTMRRGGRRLDRRTALGDVTSVFLNGGPGATVLGVSRTDVRIQLTDLDGAEAFRRLANRLVIEHRPRSVPPLDPDFYVDLLTRAGVPDTQVNRERLAERTAWTIGAQAGAYTAQLRDPQAFTVFTERFVGRAAERPTQLADDMIDWLWAWHPGCHEGIVRQVSRWRDGLLKDRDSFLLAAAGAEIPAREDTPEQDAELWRTVHERNLPATPGR